MEPSLSKHTIPLNEAYTVTLPCISVMEDESLASHNLLSCGVHVCSKSEGFEDDSIDDPVITTSKGNGEPSLVRPVKDNS